MKSKRLGTSGHRYWVIDGVDPNERDLHRIRQRPYVHVLRMPEGRTTLDFLRPVIADLERLIVTDWSCTDSRLLSEANKLQSLDLWTNEQHAIDPAALDSLHTLAVDWQPTLSALVGLASLREVMITHPPAEIARLLGPNIAVLRLNEARRVTQLVGAPSGLLSVEIAGTFKFDATSLDQYAELRSLTIADVRQVFGLVALSRRVNLDALTLDNVRTLEDRDDLHNLRAGSLLGIGRRPFAEPDVVAALRRAPIERLRLPPAEPT